MPRVKKDQELLEAMCQRFATLVDDVYKSRDSEMAENLGYANSSPLYRVRQHLAFLDVERLSRLVDLQPAPEIMINLNWLIAGKGCPLLRVSGRHGIEELTIGQYIDTIKGAKRRSD